jgi:hypothetical protein
MEIDFMFINESCLTAVSLAFGGATVGVKVRVRVRVRDGGLTRNVFDSQFS